VTTIRERFQWASWIAVAAAVLLAMISYPWSTRIGIAGFFSAAAIVFSVLVNAEMP